MGVQTVPEHLTRRLVKILGLLGSDHDGEVAAAGRRAHQLLQGAGLTWPEVIGQPPPESPHCPPRRWRRPATPSDAAAICLQWPEALSAWESEFCKSVLGRRRISPKQAEVLARVVGKVEAFVRSTGSPSGEWS